MRVQNLMSKDPSNISVNDADFRYIKESLKNDLMWGYKQIE